MSLDLTYDKSTLVQVWLGAYRHQAITWVNVDSDLFRQMASLGLNELFPSLQHNEENKHQNNPLMNA